MKQIVTLVALMWYLPSLSQNLLDSIFEDIIKEQVENYGEYGGYFEIKKRHDIISSLKYDSCNDTIYMIEDIAAVGNFNLSLWNSSDSLTYEFPFGITKIRKFDKYIETNIKNWNTKNILHGRTKQPKYYLGVTQHITSRIIIKNGQYTFDIIRYWDIPDDYFENRDTIIYWE